MRQWRRTAAWEAGPVFQEGDGHADLVLDCDLDVASGVAITASRDTTLKVGVPSVRLRHVARLLKTIVTDS